MSELAEASVEGSFEMAPSPFAFRFSWIVSDGLVSEVELFMVIPAERIYYSYELQDEAHPIWFGKALHIMEARQ